MDILEMAAAAGATRAGLLPASHEQARLMAAMSGGVRQRTSRPPRWTEQERAFLRRHTGVLSDAEIANRLGRTPTALRIERKRRGYPGPTVCRRAGLTAREVGRRLGVDSKMVSRWIEEGRLRGGLLPIGRQRWSVSYQAFKRFACDPGNWVYFDVRRVNDPHLARLIELRRQRWGDEWWDTSQVRDYWGAQYNLVAKWVRLGRIRAVQPYGKGNEYYVLRSDAVTYSFLQARGSGTGMSYDWRSENADAFLLLAGAVGVPQSVIAAMMDYPAQRVYARLSGMLRQPELAQDLINRYSLPVRYNPAGGVFADWREPVCRQRFPQTATAIDAFLRGQPLPARRLPFARSVLAVWARWGSVQDASAADLSLRLRCGGHMSRETLEGICRQMQAAGVFPLEATCSD